MVSSSATILLYLLNICSAKAALPAPLELFVEALFAIDARVITTPDTTPGVDPAQSVAISGVIMECKASVDGWSYRVRADDTRRNIIWVPEARVRAVSKTIFESPMMETRAFPVQQRLKAEQSKSATLRVNNKALRLEYPVFAGD
jgi:hypothetical protein